MPDGDAALEELISFLVRFSNVLNPVFDSIRKVRDMSKCLYEGRTFLWAFIFGHMTRQGSRNAMDANRNDPNYADAVLKVADQDDWPEGAPKNAPCSQQCCNFLSRGCTAVLEKAIVDLVAHMIRLKLLDNARFRGLFVIAVDGTKQERIRCCKWLGNRANRYVLEAKLVTPWGSAFSVASVPIKPWHDGDEGEKQDSESSFHVEKNGGYELEHNFCNKARVSRNIYLLMQIAHNLWQLFDRGCLRPLQKIRRNRNMTQKKWVEILLQKLIAVGIPIAREDVPARYLSREFLTT